MVDKIDHGNVEFIRNNLRTARWQAFGSCPPTGSKPREFRQYLWKNGITPGDDEVIFDPLGFSWLHEVDPVISGVTVLVTLRWASDGPEVQTIINWPVHMGMVSRSLAVSEAIRLAVIRGSVVDVCLARGIQAIRSVDIQEWSEACQAEAGAINTAINALRKSFEQPAEKKE